MSPQGQFGAMHPRWNGGRIQCSNGYIGILKSEHPRVMKSGYIYEHYLVAEQALKKPLPSRAVVHHVNGIKSDNRPANLVVCQDAQYHQLLHQRQRALRECGRVSWIYCWLCKEYGDPSTMVGKPGRGRGGRKHRECKRAYGRALYARRVARKRATRP